MPRAAWVLLWEVAAVGEAKIVEAREEEMGADWDDDD